MEETSKKVRQREMKFRLYFYEDKRLTYSAHAFEVTDKRLHIMLARFEENTIVGFVQWTGLKDKNGRDVFEDDIVHCSIEGDNVGNVDTIEFKNGSFWLRYRDRSLPSWTEFGNELEVIGNIYEHKHLLSQGEIKTELI